MKPKLAPDRFTPLAALSAMLRMIESEDRRFSLVTVTEQHSKLHQFARIMPGRVVDIFVRLSVDHLEFLE